jgi:DHA3 family tetracycline resistance protein-like MFS transporter
MKAYPTYLLMKGVSALAMSFFYTISTLYLVKIVGLDPLQVLLLSTCVEATVFLCEIPTGIVADVYSRKVSVVIGMALLGSAFALEGTMPYFAVIAVARVIWGVGYTFISGAEAAWIADELGEEKMKIVYLRGSQIGQLGGLLGIGLSVVVASFGLAFPLITGGAILACLAVVLALLMPEDHFSPTPKAGRSTWQSMVDTLHMGLKEITFKRAVGVLLIIRLFYGFFGEGVDLLWQIHTLSVFPEAAATSITTWVGAISATTMVLQVGVIQFLTGRLAKSDERAVGGLLVWVNVALILATLCFALAGNFVVAVASYLSLSLARSVNRPLQTAWLNRGMPSQVRATVLSISEQVLSLGAIVGGPLLGLIARYSVPVALLFAASVLVPVPFLYALARKRSVL